MKKSINEFPRLRPYITTNDINATRVIFHYSELRDALIVYEAMYSAILFKDYDGHFFVLNLDDVWDIEFGTEEGKNTIEAFTRFKWHESVDYSTIRWTYERVISAKQCKEKK